MQEIAQVTKDLNEVVSVIKVGGGATLAYLILKQTFAFVSSWRDKEKPPVNGSGKVKHPCRESQDFILMADKVKRTEGLSAENNKILASMSEAIERTADSNERQEKILEGLLKQILEGLKQGGVTR